MFNFEKLAVWQKAIDLADTIYNDTKTFPSDERFGLTNQMRRSVVSISSNIAEGSSRKPAPDFGRFIEISTGSVFELVSQSFIAKRQKFLSDKSFQSIYEDAEEIGRMLSGLCNSLKKE